MIRLFARFGDSYDQFSRDGIYQNAVSFCILQIGELVSLLTDDFKAEHAQIPWRQIRQMRNIVAHKYGTFDSSIAWEVVQEDIPDLKKFCRHLSDGQ